MRTFMTAKQQVDYLEEQGLLFEIISKEKAIKLLTHEVYYHKIVSYKHYLRGFVTTANKGDKFIGVDFNDLYDLYQLDRILRELFNEICLEVELYFKVFLMRYVENHHKLDEYFYYTIDDIDRKYKINSKMEKRIRDFDDIYSKKNLHKYPNAKPIWVLNEYLSFGEVLELFVKYTKRHGIKDYEFDIIMLYEAKAVRNITAHGNQMFVNTSKKMPANQELIDAYNNDFNIVIPPKYMSSPFMDNLASTLYIYKKLVPKDLVNTRTNNLFLRLHTFSKQNKLYTRHPNEQITIEMKYLYKIANKIY